MLCFKPKKQPNPAADSVAAAPTSKDAAIRELEAAVAQLQCENAELRARLAVLQPMATRSGPSLSPSVPSDEATPPSAAANARPLDVDQLLQWCASLPLAALLADAVVGALDLGLAADESADTVLEQTSRLAASNIEKLVTGPFCVSVSRELTAACATLNACLHIKKAADEAAVARAAKFATYASGSLAAFNAGLAERVGTPHLDFESAMRLEHVGKEQTADLPFKTHNYGIATTARREWCIAVDHSELPTAGEMGGARMLPSIEELLALPAAIEAALTRPEAIALLLYTGPMFQVYNAILRQYPADVFAKYKDGNNMFPTTIHVLVSAVQKLAGATTLPDGLVLYAGLKGFKDLPDTYRIPDSHGRRGFTEWGFRSTTADKTVALEYSGVTRDGVAAMVLAIEVGPIDCGADISAFSQYPGEKEYLWVPCSFVSPKGEPRLELVEGHGVVTVVPVYINANLKTLTVEQLLNRKKEMHLGAFSFVLDEISQFVLVDMKDRVVARKVVTTADVFAVSNSVISQCQEVFERHKAKGHLDYANDGTYRELVNEMLQTKARATSKMRYYLGNLREMNSVIKGLTLIDADRLHLAWLSLTFRSLSNNASNNTANNTNAEAKRSLAVTLCMMRGLFVDSVTESNTNGETPIMVAAAEGRGKWDLLLLVSAGAAVTERSAVNGYTPVHLAAIGGHVETLELLVREFGADVDAASRADGQGLKTALHIAAWKGQPHVVKTLLELGADPMKPDQMKRTALNYYSGLGGSVESLKFLLLTPGAINELGRDGATPIVFAALAGNTEFVKACIELGADVNIGRYVGKSALKFAIERGHTECAEVLRRAGANEPV